MRDADFSLIKQYLQIDCSPKVYYEYTREKNRFGFDFGSFDCRIRFHGRVCRAGESDPKRGHDPGNLISVDPTYVDGAFIWKLLLDPNSY